MHDYRKPGRLSKSADNGQVYLKTSNNETERVIDSQIQDEIQPTHEDDIISPKTKGNWSECNHETQNQDLEDSTRNILNNMQFNDKV